MVTENKGLLESYNKTRKQTVLLTEGLSVEDLCAQSMADASPGKWHLAHTTWFFETFLLQPHFPSYSCFDPQYNYLFNSYYDNVGERHARVQRGLLTRPSFQSVLDYRDHVDGHMQDLITQVSESNAEKIAALITIGLHHEMQHQELFLTDLLHLLSHNPLNPIVLPRSHNTASPSLNKPSKMNPFDGGLITVGVNEDATRFSYDCEQPAHPVHLSPFKLATRLVSNSEWLAFIEDGGYQNALLWLSDGWAVKTRECWQAPLYWRKIDNQWHQFGLDGLTLLDPNAPVCHISYFEANAFAQWCGKRLPREHEWECIAGDKPIAGNFLESYRWRPSSAESLSTDFGDMYGDVWEWTQSAFSPYPGFQAKQGALGEYNGKFMVNQFVLKGGSCVTPRLQMRKSYRNFFYPHQRWQFMGLRLAEDS